MFEALDGLLVRKNQRFVCRDTSWPQPGLVRHTAYLRHDIGTSLDKASLAEMRAQVGEMPEILEFYRKYGSVRLFCDTIASDVIGYASAYYIAPPEAWPELREAFEPWLEELSEEERDELLPEWINSYVVIGEVPNSGNYFLIPLEGAERGKVFEFEHDGFEFIDAGKNLAEFLNTKATVTEELLQEFLTHTRYSDGKSATQWLCESYHYDP